MTCSAIPSAFCDEPASLPPDGPAGGDLSGDYPNPTLVEIIAGGTFGDSTHVAQVTVDTKGRVTAISSVLITGAAPVGPAGGDLAGSYPNPTLAVIIAGGTFGDASHVAQVTVDTKGRVTAVSAVLITGTAPGGVAGGDLAGTYPNPTLAAIIAGGTFGDASHVAQVTVDTKGRVTAVSAVAITGTTPGGAAGGDLAGTYPNPTLAAIIAGGTFGDASHVAQTTADTKGRITAIAAVAITGRYLGVQVISGATTSYTPTSGTTRIHVVAVAAGGGGGGASSAAVSAAAGGGGASGAVVEKDYTGIGAGPYTVAAGTAGTAGSSAGGNGGTGGDTTFTDGSVLITAKGGLGGNGQAAGTTFNFVDGGSGVVGTNGDVNGSGAPGIGGIRQNGLTAASGAGGSTPWGGGGAGRSTNGTGNGGLGFGSGGSGGLVQNGSAAVAGGAGKGGVLMIYEYS